MTNIVRRETSIVSSHVFLLLTTHASRLTSQGWPNLIWWTGNWLLPISTSLNTIYWILSTSVA